MFNTQFVNRSACLEVFHSDSQMDVQMCQILDSLQHADITSFSAVESINMTGIR